MRIFVDMDGTLAKWNNVEFEQLFEEGYYRNLEPNQELLDEVNSLIRQGEDVYILSAYLTESNYAKSEKQEWVKQYLPELKEDKQIFVPYGTNKAEYLKEHYSPITNQDYLVDDYTQNLLEWKEYGGIGVKYLNGINHTRGTWNGLMINEKPHGLSRIKDKSLYGLILSEKLKSYGINLIASAISVYPDKNYRTCQVHFEGKCHYFQYGINRTNEELNDGIFSIVNAVRNEAGYKQIFNVDTDPSMIDVASNYYSRHYPTLSRCRDFDKLVNNLDYNTLDNMEYTIYLYDISGKLPEMCMNPETATRFNSKTIEWYEELIDTNELLSDFLELKNQDKDKKSIKDVLQAKKESNKNNTVRNLDNIERTW